MKIKRTRRIKIETNTSLDSFINVLMKHKEILKDKTEVVINNDYYHREFCVEYSELETDEEYAQRQKREQDTINHELNELRRLKSKYENKK